MCTNRGSYKMLWLALEQPQCTSDLQRDEFLKDWITSFMTILQRVEWHFLLAIDKRVFSIIPDSD